MGALATLWIIAMKAYFCRIYGEPSVLELVDTTKPIPKDDEILVRVHATSVTSGDVRVRSLEVPAGLGFIARLMLGFTKPRQPILGTELAGVVEAIGSTVTRFNVGDDVFAFPGGKMGCYAEYRTMKENGPVMHKPASLSFAEAASLCFGGFAAMDFLRKAEIKNGGKILIIGASGGVGTALVQLAKYSGADVTAVTSSANVNLVRSLGADTVIDYRLEDFVQGDVHYDVIMDVVGATSFGACKHKLIKTGRYAPIAGGIGDILAMLWAPLITGKKVIAGPAEERVEYLAQIADLAASGVLKPVIDRSYSFAQMVEAHRYVDTGRKKGSVVIVLS
ncbi:MAG: NAD(P)-dependent alcohol dehydrogenase [Chakrabartia sp.]